MKNTASIHNLDTLEKEIYRLKLEVRSIEKSLDNNFEHLQQNCSSMFMNSFFQKKKHEEKERNSFFDSFFKNENFNGFVNKVTQHITNKASEGIDDLINRLFQKHK